MKLFPWKFFRKIQVDIVTIFVLLLASSSLIIIYYMYDQNYKNILQTSKTIIKNVNESALEKINDYAIPAQNLAKEIKALFSGPEEINLENRQVISFLLNTLNVNQLIYSINVTGSNGNFLSVIDITNMHLYNYYSMPNKPLPNGTKYAIRLINYSETNPFEIWEYLDTELNTIGNERMQPTFDPRKDAWYATMEQWPGLHWERVLLPRGVGLYKESNQPGLAVSDPLLDKNGNILLLISINVTFDQLANFIAYQKIGKSGQTIVLDSDGDIVIPTEPLPKQYSDILNTISFTYGKTKQQTYLINEKGTEFLARIIEFPFTQGNMWSVAVIVPFNDFFGPIIETERRTLYISFGILILFSIFVFFASRHISKPIIQLSKEVDKIRHFDFEEPAKIRSRIIEIVTLNNAIQAMRAALKSFGRYIPKDIVKSLVEQGQEIVLGGERRDIVLMFTDIANFTAFSENVSMDKLTTFLKSYFGTLSNIILQAEGTIDKYIGDSIMVFWGAPQSVENKEKKACLTALRCLTICKQKQKEQPDEDWSTRFGLHEGDAIVGNIGTTERMNYTVMGDTVNTSSRLQAINKDFHTSIIISEIVQKKIGDEFVVRPLDYFAVRGKKNKIMIYELMGTRQGEFPCSAEQIELSEEFTKAYLSFHQGNLGEAKRLFQNLEQKFPEDQPIKIYLARLET